MVKFRKGMAMVVDNFIVKKLSDTLYGILFQYLGEDAIYCEIQLQRDRSSFAGIALKITEKENNIVIRKCRERLVRILGQYERLYLGCEEDYITSIKKFFSLKKSEYGIEILFLVYSDVRSSQIVFERLMNNIDNNAKKIKGML